MQNITFAKKKIKLQIVLINEICVQKQCKSRAVVIPKITNIRFIDIVKYDVTFNKYIIYNRNRISAAFYCFFFDDQQR